ncbi:MAG: hypothetical protein E7318_03910 [Clostridiales bacterium]|nr:hypothetical protein [Clostridiales bacterium]
MSNLFRKKSLERISSPEQLNSYIRVSTPSVWLLLTAIVILLLGVCVWGVFGHMDTTLPAVAVAQEGSVTAWVREADAEKVSAGAAVTVDCVEGTVLSIDAEPVRVDDSFTDYMRHVGSLQAGEWVFAVVLDVNCPDGVYAAQIVIDSVSPMSFVLN